MKKKKISSFNDGILGVYKKSSEYKSFSDRKNSKSLDDLEYKKSLYFKLENIRKEDFLFASNRDRNLSIKLKTLLDYDVETSDKILIDNHLFDIVSLDPDNFNKELYFYLEEVRVIER